MLNKDESLLQLSLVMLLLLLLLLTFSLISKREKKDLHFLLTFSLSSLGNGISAKKRKRGRGRLFCHRETIGASMGGGVD